jgi:hypothetical protein
MHQEAYDYIRRQLQGADTRGWHVIEIGSYNVNGSVRPLFPGAASYVDIDVRPGPGVDVVGHAAQWDGVPYADCVVSTETLEHDPDPEATIRACWRMLMPGGLLLLTAASPSRAPHGCDGQEIVPAGEHYAGIGRGPLRLWLQGWEAVQLESYPECGDIYARAVKPLGR